MPYHLTFCRVPPRASIPPFRTSSLSNIQELANKGRLQTIDDDIVLLVRNPPPPPLDAPSSVGRAVCLLNDESVRIYMPPLMHL